MKMILAIIPALILIAVISGCALRGQVMDGDGMVNCYKHISQEEAMKMMEADDGHVIVDVRRQDGYNNVYEFGGIVDWTGEIVK